MILDRPKSVILMSPLTEPPVSRIFPETNEKLTFFESWKNVVDFYLVWDHSEWWVVWFRSSTWEQRRPASQSISLHAQKWFYAEMEKTKLNYFVAIWILWHLPALGKSPNHGHHSILGQYRMNWHRFQRHQRAGQCADAEGSCEYCTLGVHV